MMFAVIYLLPAPHSAQQRPPSSAASTERAALCRISFSSHHMLKPGERLPEAFIHLGMSSLMHHRLAYHSNSTFSQDSAASPDLQLEPL
jgi:hypothetical protein